MYRYGVIVLLAAAACARSAPPPAARAAAPDTIIPSGPLGDAIRRGRAIALATRDSLPRNVGNKLRCVSCHLDEGRRPTGTWVGSFAHFPMYRARSGLVETIEFRVNDCFRRSMSGTALDPQSPDMRDIVAYLWFLSRGTTVHEAAPSTAAQRFLALSPDTAAGRALFGTTCAKCHAADGHGSVAAPPVWGPQSFNIGAGMSRLSTAANFVRNNMPFDQPGTLTDQQAVDVAAFVIHQPRADFAGKERDWPNGDPPKDVAYPTLIAAHKTHRP